ncbi:MAG: glycosyltransferase [Fusobacteriaceae bacterium]
MKIIDFSKEGHHGIYQENLLKIDGVNLNIFEEELSLKFNKLYFFKKVYKILFLEKIENIHFLTLDFLYKYPLLKKLDNNRLVIGTLHKEPNTFLKKILLKNFSKRISTIVVHSEFLKIELEKIGVKNVEVIEYPTFYDYSKIDRKKLREKENLEDKIVISCLGGTRYDKGLDIILESFKYLDEKLKNRIVLNIVGKEEHFKREYIQEIAKKNKINLREKYGFVTDEDFTENVLITDIMAMPYRKIFGGNSGPMTEAVANKIPSIAPKDTNIGSLTTKYDLGETFEAENLIDLAKVITKLILDKDKKYFLTDYYKKLNTSNFIKKHKELYKIKK